MSAPIIIIGMHRSGTSMITRMLESLGLWVGKKKEQNHEAVFFLKLNEWLLRQSGGAWDHPEPIRYLLENPDIRPLLADYLKNQLDGPRVASFMGVGNYLRHRTPEKMTQLWGWKDPRNTFTLPIWMDLFPDAKVVHVYRHGVDVASSLKVRQERMLARWKARYPRLKPLFHLYPKKAGFTNTLRCASLDGGLGLWEEYMAESLRQVERYGDRAFELKYEDFLEDPAAHLAPLAAFCGLSAPNDLIAQLTERVNKDRAYAFRNRPELAEFAETARERLAMYGY